jgi:hypothetical protein
MEDLWRSCFQCFVCDLNAVSQFFSCFSIPQLFTSHLHTQQYTPTYVYILRTSRPGILADLITPNVEFPAPLSISSRLKLSPGVSIWYKRILRICSPWRTVTNEYFKTHIRYKITTKENSTAMLMYFAASNKNAYSDSQMSSTRHKKLHIWVGINPS